MTSDREDVTCPPYLLINKSSTKRCIMEVQEPTDQRTLEIASLEPVRLQMTEVEPHPDNPRVHSAHQINELKESLLEHQYVAGSMVVQKSRMRLVKGHGIYQALIELECRFADFILVDMDDEEALIFLMRDNRLSDLSSWHTTKFLTNVENLMSRIGFSMKQIDAMALTPLGWEGVRVMTDWRAFFIPNGSSRRLIDDKLLFCTIEHNLIGPLTHFMTNLVERAAVTDQKLFRFLVSNKRFQSFRAFKQIEWLSR